VTDRGQIAAKSYMNVGQVHFIPRCSRYRWPCFQMVPDIVGGDLGLFAPGVELMENTFHGTGGGVRLVN